MSGVIPKITIETENSSRPTVKIENPINLDGIKITNADSDSDESLSTVELEKKVTKPKNFKKNERSKDNNSDFNSKDYHGFLNTSKTKQKEPSTYSSSGSETESYSDSYSGSESSSDSESSKNSVNSNKNVNKKQQKRELLLQLASLEKRGVELTKKFSMSSKLSDLKFEYELHRNKAELDVSIKFQQKVLIAAVTGLEMANNTFDPIGANLNGWSESVMDNLDDYESIFIKLHEKYKSRAELPPELQLLLTLVASGFMFHMTKTFFNKAFLGEQSSENSEILKKIAASMSNTEKSKSISNNPLSGPSINYSNMLNDDDTVSSGSIETSKEVTVNGKGKRAINL